ncbi:hypothetical protein ABZW30_30000 [Kitasatospora sp. NPDC004669]|uniref:hypothetical protein n=1 Tax=Kitasatospora sp. NPDC004669 TaxID=3154555 RepID=UPI0033A90902
MGCTEQPTVQWRRRSTGTDDTTPVYACHAHAISLDGAAHVHQPECIADPGRLPVCSCVPEPIPAADELLVDPAPAAASNIPPHWVNPPKSS